MMKRFISIIFFLSVYFVSTASGRRLLRKSVPDSLSVPLDYAHHVETFQLLLGITTEPYHLRNVLPSEPRSRDLTIGRVRSKISELKIASFDYDRLILSARVSNNEMPGTLSMHFDNAKISVQFDAEFELSIGGMMGLYSSVSSNMKNPAGMEVQLEGSLNMNLFFTHSEDGSRLNFNQEDSHCDTNVEYVSHGFVSDVDAEKLPSAVKVNFESAIKAELGLIQQNLCSDLQQLQENLFSYIANLPPAEAGKKDAVSSAVSLLRGEGQDFTFPSSFALGVDSFKMKDVAIHGLNFNRAVLTLDKVTHRGKIGFHVDIDGAEEGTRMTGNLNGETCNLDVKITRLSLGFTADVVQVRDGTATHYDASEDGSACDDSHSAKKKKIFHIGESSTLACLPVEVTDRTSNVEVLVSPIAQELAESLKRAIVSILGEDIVLFPADVKESAVKALAPIATQKKLIMHSISLPCASPKQHFSATPSELARSKSETPLGMTSPKQMVMDRGGGAGKGVV